MAKNAIAKIYNPYLWPGGGYGSRPSFSESTTFPSAENPIASGWQNNSNWYSKCIVAGAGNCYGLQPNPYVTDQYQDAYAYRLGYNPIDQYSEVVLKKGATAGGQEWECLLNWFDTPNTTRGYECGINTQGSYAFINIALGIKLSGPANLSNYDLGPEVVTGVPILPDGTLLKAYRQAWIITMAYGGTSLALDGTTILTFDTRSGGRTPLIGGGPGFGFFSGPGSAANSLGAISSWKGMDV